MLQATYTVRPLGGLRHQVIDPEGREATMPLPYEQAKDYAWLLTYARQQRLLEAAREAMGS